MKPTLWILALLLLADLFLLKYCNLFYSLVAFVIGVVLSIAFVSVLMTYWSQQTSWRFSLRTLIVGTTLLAVGLGLITSLLNESTLQQRIEPNVARSFPLGTNRQAVEDWTKSQPSETSTFGKPDLSTIDGFAVQEARIDPKAIHHIVRSKYRDERWSGVSWVFLFFFFDENDHLIGHSFYEEGVWL